MLIGVSKCGTTDLFHRLAKHPQIFPSKRKEVRFWNRQRIGVLAINGKCIIVLCLSLDKM